MNRPLRLTECFVGVFGMFATHFVAVSCIFHGVFVAFLQTVSSRRGPIYRARIYENTHEMGDECTFEMKWICAFDNVKMRIR